jgi:hypothetical protein
VDKLSDEEARAFRDIVNAETYPDIHHWVSEKLAENTRPKGAVFIDRMHKAFRESWKPQNVKAS